MLFQLAATMLLVQGLSRAAAPLPRAGTAVARAVAQAPVLDGRLDEPAWAEAVPFGDFIQRSPDEGQPATERTEVRVVYTATALFVGLRAFDRQPGLIAGPLARRDEAVLGDWIGVMIDTYLDRRTAFEFAVNPAGVKRDVYRFNDVEEDPGWNAIWDAATSRDAEGWTAELRIPISQLRGDGARSRFGFNVWRRLHRRNELQYWRPPPSSAAGVVSLFGTLDGLDGFRPRRPVEATPYVLASSTLRPGDLDNPFERGTAATATAGADLRVGLTAGLTLTAAVNPDFGQVDADPAEVNLTGFETFFPERRPLFTEGVDLFQFPLTPWRDGSDQLFYSRRIGRTPQLKPDDRGGWAEPPRQTNILGAGKLSGRLGPWRVGMLGALTQRATTRVEAADGRRYRDLVEPRSTALVGRLARDWRGGQTTAGVFGTALHRSIGPEALELRGSAITLGADAAHRFRDDTWSIRASLAGSRVTGAPEAILATQRGATHRFQRPDQTWARVDSAATALGGWAGLVSAGKHGGGNWLAGATVFGRSPGFEANDLGFLRWAGRYVVESGVTRRWLTPGRVFRNASVRLGEWGQWTWGGERFNLGSNLNTSATLRNFWTVRANLWRGVGGSDVDALRGGPALRMAGDVWSGFGVETDPRSTLRLALDAEAWRGSDGESHGVFLAPTLTWRPSTRQEWSLGPSLRVERNGAQYLKTGRALGRDEHIVGVLDQRTTRLTVRGNVTFTPALSLQGYVEPFIATGRHQAFRRVAVPGARTVAERYDVLGEDRLLRDGAAVAVDLDRDGAADLDLGTPDFTSLSLRSNVVLRWEYLTGSTLFLVWQHGREVDGSLGPYGIGRGLSELGRAPAANVVLVKAAYWIGR